MPKGDSHLNDGEACETTSQGGKFSAGGKSRRRRLEVDVKAHCNMNHYDLDLHDLLLSCCCRDKFETTKCLGNAD